MHKYARLGVSAVLVAACGAHSSGTPRGAPRAAAARVAHPPEGAGSPRERNERCEACHEDVAREWRASLHRASGTHPIYLRAFAREPLPFCTRCHAPESDPASPASVEASIGAGCITCHRVEAGGSGLVSRVATAPCAGCHEFPFEDGSGKMQLTMTEHRASARATTPCASCHMRDAGQGASTHKDHTFAASRDPVVLRRAAAITARREADAVVVRFEPVDIGHALPTGDLFRRLRVLVNERDDGAPRAEVLLGRKTKQGSDRDDRPFRDGRAAEVRVALAAPGRAIAWRVIYERVDHPRSLDERDAQIDGAVELASGELAP